MLTEIPGSAIGWEGGNMRVHFGALFFSALASPALAASPVITENLTGTVQGVSTIDTKGYFGVPGADLRGAAVAVYLQYVPKLFGPSQECRTQGCTFNVSAQMPDTPGALLITVTIKGHRLVYSPVSEAAVFFGTQSPYQLTLDSDALSGFGIGLRGLQLAAQFTAAPLFGRPLPPISDPGHASSREDYIAFYDAASQTPIEQLTYKVTTASK